LVGPQSRIQDKTKRRDRSFADVKRSGSMSSDDLQKKFPGGGEIGARMRILDWSATPLGSPEHWPQTLRVAIRILLTSRYAMLFPPVLGAKIEQEFRRAMTERVAVHFEERYEPLQGWFEVNVYPNANGGLSIFFRDVSERKLSEVLLTRQNKRLRLLWEAAGILLSTDEPDAMLSGLFTKIHDTLGFDVYFSFIVNETAADQRVVSSAGISETAAKSISCLAFEQVVDHQNEINRKPVVAIDIQQTEDEKWQVAKAFGVRCLASNPLLAGDRLLGTLSFASRTRDDFDADELEFLETISRYVTATYERLRLIGQLRESDRRKDEFLATLAHELRNPMAPIRNGLQLMRLGKSPEIQEQAPDDGAAVGPTRSFSGRLARHQPDHPQSPRIAKVSDRSACSLRKCRGDGPAIDRFQRSFSHHKIASRTGLSRSRSDTIGTSLLESAQ
jgi:hypothetical protein